MRSLEQSWYQGAGWLILLWPVSLAFRILAAMRRRYHSSVARTNVPPVPVVVVGNISVGGTGKTPLIVGLAQALQKEGLRPGIISRGYLGKAPHYPFSVQSDSRVSEVGDEALLIARALNCPMVVDPDRVQALEKLVSENQCDVVLSDDGMQHYALPRDLEVVVVDGERLFGNGWCLPAGPLREPVSRLRSVPYVVINGEQKNGGLTEADVVAELERAYTMNVKPTYLVNLLSGEKKPFRGAPFNIGTSVHAVTGIGNPNRFYNLLATLPYKVMRHDFPDHHPFTEQDFEALAIDDRQPIVMTEKDAVKCQDFAGANFWYLKVDVELSGGMLQKLLADIRQLVEQRGQAQPSGNNGTTAGKGQ